MSQILRKSVKTSTPEILFKDILENISHQPRSKDLLLVINNFRQFSKNNQLCLNIKSFYRHFWLFDSIFWILVSFFANINAHETEHLWPHPNVLPSSKKGIPCPTQSSAKINCQSFFCRWNIWWWSAEYLLLQTKKGINFKKSYVQK